VYAGKLNLSYVCPTSSLQIVLRKWWKGEKSHLLAAFSSAEVKNAWSYISTPPASLHGMVLKADIHLHGMVLS
jgi:hypothetical protein